jgi:hypothetical protein
LVLVGLKVTSLLFWISKVTTALPLLICRSGRKSVIRRLMKKLVFLAVVTLLGVPSLTKAGIQDRLYDFTDAYYQQNGINPAAIDGRRQVGPLAAADTPIFPYQRGVRALLTLPNYDHSGNDWFFTVLGGFSTSAFTSDAAGQRARQIADSSVEYVFPRTGTDPVGLGALRQSVMLDLRNGYFSNNKLSLWLHVWVSYTAMALATSDGLKMMNDMARRNGRDLDGTAIIASVSEIDNLFSKGYITKTTRPLNDVLRYSICPVIKDPRDGGIARDQFLAYTRKPDGSALEPEFLENFISLQTTGREAH